MRSRMTSDSERPGTSTPCHRERVPNSDVASSSAKALISWPVESSPWHSTGVSSRSRMASAAALAARMDENSPRVRPPAAPTSPSISAR